MYYLMINGQRTGPYSADDIKQMYERRGIGPETQYWRDGMYSWERIDSSPQLFGLRPIAYADPVYQQPSYPPMNHGMMYQQPGVIFQPAVAGINKSRVGYILLGLFLGGLGIHNFYAGYTGKAIAQLLLNLFLFWTIVVPIGVAIWVIVEVITVDRDAYGQRFI